MIPGSDALRLRLLRSRGRLHIHRTWAISPEVSSQDSVLSRSADRFHAQTLLIRPPLSRSPPRLPLIRRRGSRRRVWRRLLRSCFHRTSSRSEEHTSELQSRFDLVCRLLLEKKKNITDYGG